MEINDAERLVLSVCGWRPALAALEVDNVVQRPGNLP